LQKGDLGLFRNDRDGGFDSGQKAGYRLVALQPLFDAPFRLASHSPLDVKQYKGQSPARMQGDDFIILTSSSLLPPRRSQCVEIIFLVSNTNYFVYKEQVRSPSILFAWIGTTDLRAAAGDPAVGLGPVAVAITQRQFDALVLLNNFPEDQSNAYVAWLKERTSLPVTVKQCPLSSPTDFSEIYTAARAKVAESLEGSSNTPRLTFHLSPGTPSMAAVWIILAKTKFGAELIESSLKHGVHTVSFPFDLAADFYPDLLRSSDEKFERLTVAESPPSPEFADIVHRSASMAKVVEMARHVAYRSVPVLLEGESGTGKELFARAIHRASPRGGNNFVAVNCGAIPAELVESELFGHERGAFTGADRQAIGQFEAADNGSLFLDEIGELPLAAQVKLLRALQGGEIRRIGSTRATKINVRIIAATNRNLLGEIGEGRFRIDLFYRLAVGVIRLPPLREREGDISLLIDHCMKQINAESTKESGEEEKALTAGARRILLQHSWPGNVRELLNTVRRATIWTHGTRIESSDIQQAILPSVGRRTDDILNLPLESGIDLPGLIEKVAQHYLTRALKIADGNKSKAAEIVGLSSYQTFSNWMKRHSIEMGA
jgi:DNA-binding NtrC family response regulator